MARAKDVYNVTKELTIRLEGNTLYLAGRLCIVGSGEFVLRAHSMLRRVKRSKIVLNLKDVNDIDSAGVMALFHVRKEITKGKVKLVEFEEGSESVNKRIELFNPGKVKKQVVPNEPNLFERIGTNVYEFFSSYLYSYLLLTANIFYWGFHDLFTSRSRREGEVVNQAIKIGVSAALIVMFMAFVIGLVMTLHSAGQLRSFGANIFIVDLVVLSMMSQMGPLITAILVAGRSGSSIAAEVATMKVTSELDALRTMGLNPNRFVVIPKLYGCMITLPFLVVLANTSGILGGAIAAYQYLDISPDMFINRTAVVMSGKDLFTGLVKSQVYAVIIVLTGSFYGFRADRGAEGVGRVTTTAVVVAISLVIFADSILGLLFY